MSNPGNRNGGLPMALLLMCFPIIGFAQVAPRVGAPGMVVLPEMREPFPSVRTELLDKEALKLHWGGIAAESGKPLKQPAGRPKVPRYWPSPSVTSGAPQFHVPESDDAPDWTTLRKILNQGNLFPTPFPVPVGVTRFPAPGGLPPGSQHQTIEGGTAGDVVLAASASAGFPGSSIPAASAREKAEQAECDEGLKSGKAALDIWKLVQMSKPGGNAASRVTFDRFDIWLREQDQLDEASQTMVTQRKKAMASCFAASAPDDLPDALARRVGVIAGATGKSDCSGIQIDANKVLTAGHCIQVNNGQGGVRDASSAEIRAYKFLLRDNKAYAVVRVHSRGPTRQLADEWLVLETAEMPSPQGAFPLAPTPESLPPGTPMLVAGLVDSQNGGAASVGFTRGDSCRAVYATPSCIVHTCNTVPGLSGAPLFAKASGQWVFAGVHVRFMRDADFRGACAHPASEPARSSFTNGGVYVPSFLR